MKKCTYMNTHSHTHTHTNAHRYIWYKSNPWQLAGMDTYIHMWIYIRICISICNWVHFCCEHTYIVFKPTALAPSNNQQQHPMSWMVGKSKQRDGINTPMSVGTSLCCKIGLPDKNNNNLVAGISKDRQGCRVAEVYCSKERFSYGIWSYL